MSVAVSESARRELTRWYGMRDVEVIENAVDVDHFIPGPRSGMLGRSEDDRLLVLFVGSPHRVKGVDRLSAFATANADWCDVVAAGLPPEGMVEGVRCIGAVPYGQLPALYREADFLVMPSRYEACSFVLLEALSCGLPALTTSVGTAPDIARRCPTLAPLVIEEWSAVEVARACRVLQDSSRRAELGVASREYAVAHHGLAPFVAKYAAALAEAAQR